MIVKHYSSAIKIPRLEPINCSFFCVEFQLRPSGYGDVTMDSDCVLSQKAICEKEKQVECSYKKTDY